MSTVKKIPNWLSLINSYVYSPSLKKKCKVIKILDGFYYLQNGDNIYQVNTFENIYLYGRWKPREKDLILQYYSQFGKRWSIISEHMPWRSCTQIRSHMQKVFIKNTNLKQKFKPKLNHQGKIKGLNAREKKAIRALQLLKQ